ncbi:MAG: aromatic/alkene monooxygenase hydroxylase subunit beta [Candidatus Thiodiazotropha sp. (ex Lucina aurantia)]|nr:aromatic/alkene monooxygenase hydroxylase subunit beta [Candidatus Thiodiazotropha sp. (ex Lucina pensylvanica)]MBT3022768.1 aromatic/alkene monooxygenase hydroxylase subunit beta [Candidatus Thiodiazotropha taylori]MBV2099367.1 aromatic/alkene monooxygenase hydroxylase subunit beta [Candidatus Thiodiazotropha sp. (ex Codakia orbicularis)]MBV2101523.1 aromatic/alkene monooxygenase hydroxylase subunit beta [Candidatus Thiodiazotropha sp. (ex Lucina aurantia)]MBV2115928.1 aromatic/alkene monoo
MSIDIKTVNVEPRRQTFAHVARRLGSDVPASRYEEGVYDVQATTHFHYRPIWGPEYWTFDEGRTAIRMQDWYLFKDPRQFYYGTYTIARANMHQTTERNFAFEEKRDMLANIDPAWRELIVRYLIPLRHYEWGANMNACSISDAGYGTAITSAAIFTAGDRLGIAQILSRIGIVLGSGNGELLDEAKTQWMEADAWQGVRKAVEDSLVLKDWFEALLAQFLVMDGLVYPLVYNHFDTQGQKHGAAALSMLCEFMVDWSAEHNRWVDAVVKVASKESDENQTQLSQWYRAWRDTMRQALTPLASMVLADGAESAIADVREQLDVRAGKLGLTV